MATITTSIPFVDWPVTDDGKPLFDTKNDALPPQLQALADDSATFVTEANALRDEVNGFQQSASSSATAAATSASNSAGSASSAQTALSDVQSVIALAETVPFTLTSGDDFDSLSKVWPLIRTAFETNSLPWKPIVNLDFARDNYEAYVGLSAGTTRAPLLDLATFSRASSATGVNAFGNVETVGANQPRIVFENGVAKGILLENAATNLLTWSEDFSNASWLKRSVTPSYNSVVAPDLSLTADAFYATATSAIHAIERDSGLPEDGSVLKWFSVFVASQGVDRVLVRIGRGSSQAVGINLRDGSVGYVGGNVIDYRVERVSFGFRVSVKSNLATLAGAQYMNVTLSNLNYDEQTSGNGVDGVALWGAALTDEYTSYIKAEGTSVVRAADDFSYTLPSGFDGAGDWSFYVDFNLDDLSTSEVVIWSAFIGAPSLANVIYLRKNSLNNIEIISGSNVGLLLQMGAASTGKSRVVLKKEGSSMYATVNAGSIVSDTTVLNANIIGNIYLGFRGYANVGYLNNTISSFKIFPTALPDVVCQAITGV